MHIMDMEERLEKIYKVSDYAPFKIKISGNNPPLQKTGNHMGQ